MFQVAALYKFCPIPPERLPILRQETLDYCAASGIRGLLLLSVEGVNATMAGLPAAMDDFLTWLQAVPEIGELTVKFSRADSWPFEKLKVDLREEIVALKRPDIVPPSGNNYHLSPEEWHAFLNSDRDFLLIDTRNTYESDIGKFRGAITPPLANFSDFPEYVRQADIPRDRTILMYCTGGIRCEKALIFLQQEGYRNVFQLDGGILNYLEKYPDGAWEGECFVFDERIAVDNHLQPTRRYRRCPHCGDPATESVLCAFCGANGYNCSRCAVRSEAATCSKNCAYQFRLRQAKEKSPETGNKMP
ncbi:MAG: rhodanese-like domain-containing protein [Capsulimonadales bacterium]|nr:rhodanese-like domain-containing protein [Capsulimonadales bacterium]